MILGRAVGVNVDPSPSSSPLQYGERRTDPLAGEAPSYNTSLVAFWLRRRNIVTSPVVSWRYPGRLALFKGEGEG